jgi:hypothetical protein
LKPHTLVVARFNEDTAWTRKVKKPWRVEVLTKGEHLPNVGREATTFLAAMEALYDTDGYLAFAQGNPLPHCAVWNVLRPVNGFTWMGDPRYTSDADGNPWHPGLPVKSFCEQHIGPFPGQVRFAAGGQFIIPAHLLRTHPRTKYGELYQAVVDEPQGPWVMERLWQVLFNNGVSTHSAQEAGSDRGHPRP